MNTTLRRIALTAPLATALLGLGIGAAQADVVAKGSSDTIAVAPIVDPKPLGLKAKEPAADPAPAEDPKDEAADDTEEPTVDKSDNGGATTGDRVRTRPAVVTSGTATATTEEVATDRLINTASTKTDTIEPVFSDAATGVQIPAGATIGGVLVLALTFVWAGLRHHREWAREF